VVCQICLRRHARRGSALPRRLTEWVHKSARLLLYCRDSREIPNDERITARHMLLAVGLPYFKHIPSEYTQMPPAEAFTHTCDMGSFDAFQGQRCLIVGGRQRAFE
jgi:hypothetical protein